MGFRKLKITKYGQTLLDNFAGKYTNKIEIKERCGFSSNEAVIAIDELWCNQYIRHYPMGLEDFFINEAKNEPN